MVFKISNKQIQIIIRFSTAKSINTYTILLDAKIYIFEGKEEEKLFEFFIFRTVFKISETSLKNNIYVYCIMYILN